MCSCSTSASRDAPPLRVRADGVIAKDAHERQRAPRSQATVAPTVASACATTCSCSRLPGSRQRRHNASSSLVRGTDLRNVRLRARPGRRRCAAALRHARRPRRTSERRCDGRAVRRPTISRARTRMRLALRANRWSALSLPGVREDALALVDAGVRAADAPRARSIVAAARSGPRSASSASPSSAGTPMRRRVSYAIRSPAA